MYRLRKYSDGPADVALSAIEQEGPVKANEDVLTRLSASKTKSTGTAAFWDHITARPPPGAGALSQDWYNERQGRHISLEEELEAERAVLERGQAVFYRYYAGMLVSVAFAWKRDADG